MFDESIGNGVTSKAAVHVSRSGTGDASTGFWYVHSNTFTDFGALSPDTEKLCILALV
jgi:hypothetical protein